MLGRNLAALLNQSPGIRLHIVRLQGPPEGRAEVMGGEAAVSLDHPPEVGQPFGLVVGGRVGDLNAVAERFE